MSYAGFGDTTSWKRVFGSPGEVYLWRAVVSPAPVTPEQLGAIAEAVGEAQGNADVRGATAALGGKNPIGQPWPTSLVDVVLTFPSYKADPAQAAVVAVTGTPLLLPPGTGLIGWPRADQVATAAQKKLAAQGMRDATVAAAQWLQLTAPEYAVDFWKDHTVYWSQSTKKRTAAGQGAQGLYLGGFADKGGALPGLKPWTLDSGSLGPGGGGAADSPFVRPDGSIDWAATLPWVAGAAAVAYIGYRFFQRRAA